MSKLQELIRELCPEGVEFKKLGEVGEFIRGNGLQKKDFTEDGVGCIHYGQIYTYYGTSTDKTKSFVSEGLAKKLLQVYPGNLVIACTSENVEDVGKAVAWLGDETIVTGGHSVVFRHTQNPKYIAYFFQTESFFTQKKKYAFGAKVIDIKTVDLAKIEIPLPPLPVQEEIVRILDCFSEYTAELQAELQARKEQYEYYRNLLLTVNPSAYGYRTDGEQKTKVVWKTLGEVCRGISSGKNNQKTEDGAYPVYGSTGIIAMTNSYKYSQKQILIARVGANAGYVHIGSGKYDVSDNTIIVDLDSKQNFKFIYYLLVNMSLNQYAKGGGQPLITASLIKQLSIPLPPLSEQQRIVDILDRFESLVNDLTNGLPAELQARKEQYEYYRNRLLTFERLA